MRSLQLQQQCFLLIEQQQFRTCGEEEEEEEEEMQAVERAEAKRDYGHEMACQHYVGEVFPEHVGPHAALRLQPS